MWSAQMTTYLQVYKTPRISVSKCQSFLPYDWLSAADETNLEKGSYTKITLDEDSPEYKNIKALVLLNNAHVRIKHIEQVENPYMYLIYLMKRHENYMEFFCKEELCFHGTPVRNLNSIMTNNLNWRYFGRATGCAHGRGVYFSKKASVSTQYATNNGKGKGCLLVVKVQIAAVTEGNDQSTLPAQNYDTTGSGDDILVKYFDYEFLPEFVVYLD